MEHRDRPHVDASTFPVTSARLAARDAALARFATQIHTTVAEVEDMRKRLDRQTRELISLTNQIEETKSELFDCQWHHDAVMASTSWRITAPLRGLSIFVRRLLPSRS